jgi:Tol biopolymer transport system component
LIETLPRRGYRFIAPVQKRDGIRERLELPAAPEPTSRLSSTKRLALLASFLCVVVLAVVLMRLKLWSSPPIPKVIDSVQITRVGQALSRTFSDGTRLYFETFVPPRRIDVMQVSSQGGETIRMSLPIQEPILYDISPTGLELLVGGSAHEESQLEEPLWVVPLPAGSPYRVGDILAHDACWAPDGRHLVFANEKHLFVTKPDGSEVRKLATLDTKAYGIRYSPDGTRLRFTSLAGLDQGEIMEIGANGSGLHRLPIRGCCGAWSADGMYYYYQTDRDIWVLPERRSILRKIEFGAPVQLTTGPVPFQFPMPSPNGKQLFVLGRQPRVELVRYESRSKRFVPFLGGISGGELEVSPDGQWVAYTTYPESNLWRSKPDGSERLQLTFAPINAHEPRWSPDGKKILFTDVPSKLFVVPAEGGTPQQLMPEEHPTLIGAGAWLPDGNSILFGRAMGCRFDDLSCFENTRIYLLDLQSQQVTKLPGSEKMFAARLSRNGRFVTAILGVEQGKLMLYDFQTQKWSELARGHDSNSTVWSHDSKFVYVQLKDYPAELVRVSVPDGKIEPVLDLRDMTLGGYYSGWVSLLPDDSPLLMLDRSTQEIYRLDLQYQ